MLGSFDGSKLRPGEQLVCRNQSFPHCLLVLGEVGNSLGDFSGMGKEKGHVRSARAASRMVAVSSKQARLLVLAPLSSRLSLAKRSFVVRVACPTWSHTLPEQMFSMLQLYYLGTTLSIFLEGRVISDILCIESSEF